MTTKWGAAKWTSDNPPGSAAGKDVKKLGLSPESPPKTSSSTSATGATGPGASATSPSLPKSTMSATSTTSNGQSNTAWIENPLRAVEQPWLVSDERLPLTYFEATGKDKKLQELAANIGCSISELVMQIIEYYVSEEHIIAEEGTVGELVDMYLDNEVL